MAVYAVGDIHGCLRTFEDLLGLIGFSPKNDTLWLTGDFVNRGADSLGVLRRIYAMRERVRAVVGNHDLHLLASYAGRRAPPKNESLRAVLDAPDADVLCGWLRSLPLLHLEGGYALLHAGRLPEWEQELAAELAAEAEARLRTDDDFFAALYGNTPARWHPALSADARHRTIVNAFTRLRILSADGGMIFNYVGAPQKRPPRTAPWFDFPYRKRWAATAVCGHWSSLGLLLRRDIIALDTGCGRGRTLTAICLEDRRIFQTPARAADVVQ
ncbi:MAG: symmetrical bis(5'-nucleosyl)-tetraphosphatase [Gammaproteobacteria bacterium]